MIVPPVLAFAHERVAAALGPGAVAIDATMGNGHDTLFLAGRVRPGGHVYAFDIQQAAVDATRQRLEEAGLHEGVTLLLAGHEGLAGHLPQSAHGAVGAVMFNLGYLPGGDKRVITQTESTLAALNQATGWMQAGGLISVILYPGHPGGEAEAEAVEAWARNLDPSEWQAVSYRFINHGAGAPRAVLVERRGASGGGE